MRSYRGCLFPRPSSKIMSPSTEDRLPSLFIVPLVRFFVIILLFIALLYRQPELSVLAIVVLGLVSGLKVWSRYALGGLFVRGTVDRERAFPGETLVLGLEVENRRFLPVWVQAGFRLSSSLLIPDTGPQTRDSGLLSYQKAGFRWELKAGKRGWYPVGPVRLRVSDFLGFFPREKIESLPLGVLIYPRIVPIRPVSLPRRELFGVPGRQSPVEDPIYILGTRDYQQRRPAKAIHWKASARHDRLQEKVYESSTQEKVLVVVEADRYAENRAEAEFERSLEAAVSLTRILDGQGFAVGLLSNGKTTGDERSWVRVRRDRGGMTAILEVTARLRMEASEGMGALLGRWPWMSWGLTCVYFSYDTEGFDPEVESFFRERRIPVLLVLCRAEKDPHGFHEMAGIRTVRLEDLMANEEARA